MTDPTSTPPATGWRAHRQEIKFLALFLALLLGSFTVIAFKPVNDHVIEPFTAGVAKASGFVLAAIGQGTEMSGTIIRNQRFAVNIRNGCNGVEAMLIYGAAVLAFPAAWRTRIRGFLLGMVVIQIVNLVRVVALFLTGAYLPSLFDSSHTVIWQTIVILSSVVLWIYWAQRVVPRAQAAS